jgi:RNA polymerase sigma-70 factor (ECF subfamily)
VGAPTDEPELVSRAARGEIPAYEELVRRYQGIAHRTAFLIAGAAQADDAAQAAFVKAHRALGRFDRSRPFRPWLLRIVVNEARNLRRAEARRAALELRAAGEPEPEAAPSPEDEAAARERRDALLAAVNRLDEADREVIGMRYFLELGEAETAAALGVAVGTVKSRLSRALGRLRTVMEADGA